VPGSEAIVSAREAMIPDPAGWEDPVTGLEGPVFWQTLLASEISRSTRYERPLTVVLLDIDGVRELQAAWGDEVARETIREIAQCIRRLARGSDHCTRISLGRFGILLTETNEITAINFVERVRTSVPSLLPRACDQVRFTFGWATPHPGEAPQAVVSRAVARMAADRAD